MMNEAEVSDIPQTLLSWASDPQVLIVFGIVFGTMLLNFLLQRLLTQLHIKAGETRTIWDEALLSSIRNPLRLMVWVVGVGWAAELITKQSDTGFSELLGPLRYVLVIGIIGYFLVRFIREVESGVIFNGADVTTTHAVGKLLRASVIVTAVLTVLQTLGVCWHLGALGVSPSVLRRKTCWLIFLVV